MASFVLETGFEELPSSFLPRLEKELCDRITQALDEAGIGHGQVRAMSAPRRAALFVDGLATSQPVREEIVTGPPMRVAYGADGAPTKALTGFVKTNGAGLDDVFCEKTDKGEYVALRKKTGGAATIDILATVLPTILGQLGFAKKMRWGSGTLAWARPLRWILALMDNEVVPFELGFLKSGRLTHGHRIHGPGPFEVADAKAYLEVVAQKCQVTLDPASRRQLIVETGNQLAARAGGKVIWKEDLLDEVQGLVEHPVPLLAGFDQGFLELPRDVLLTSMESHQKSFGVEDGSGKLLPYFLTVLNLEPTDRAAVAHGWERVLRARLEDARFFWHQDLADTAGHWLEKLDRVIFIGKLGSMGDKTRRLESLCRKLAEQARANGLSVEPDDAARAGRLSKADLVSGMVGEFDTLQGIMGGIYAARRGEKESVATAIAGQYLPAGPDSPLPADLCGALLSVADKADTLAGCFGLGMIPTGTADPNGLRRCSLGIIRILLGFGLDLDVAGLFADATAGYGQRQWKLGPADAAEKLLEFHTSRLRQYWLGQGHDVLLVDSVLAAGSTRLPDCAARLAALEKFRVAEGYTEAVQTFKRVANIVRKQAGDEPLPQAWDAGLLQEEAEKKLAAMLDRRLPELDRMYVDSSHDKALASLHELRPLVDAFFDGVMVMCDDLAVRRNRLAILAAMAGRFSRLADFSALQV